MQFELVHVREQEALLPDGRMVVLVCNNIEKICVAVGKEMTEQEKQILKMNNYGLRKSI